MQRVGIGGALFMDVAERLGSPRGSVEFMNLEWQRLLQFSIREADRLGMEIYLLTSFCPR